MREMASLSGLMLKLFIVWFMSCAIDAVSIACLPFFRRERGVRGTHRGGVLCEKHFGGVCVWRKSEMWSLYLFAFGSSLWCSAANR